MLNIITGKKATGYEGIRLKMKRLINIKKKTLWGKIKIFSKCNMTILNASAKNTIWTNLSKKGVC